MAREWWRLERTNQLVVVPADAFEDPVRLDLHGRSEGSGWPVSRGPIRWDGVVDLAGGFPGSASWSGWAEAVQLHLTEQFLLINEGQANGFGMPLTWLDAAQSTAGAAPVAIRDEGVFTVRYYDGTWVRSFTLRIHKGRLPFGARRRADQLQSAFYACGLMGFGPATEAPSAMDADFSLSWDQVGSHENENVVWSGRVNAPIDQGIVSAPCDLWLTTESLIWGSVDANGVNHVALNTVVDVTSTEPSDDTRPPALIVGVRTAEHCRVDLPIIFDQYTHPAERNVREWRALSTAFRARGVAVGVIEAPPQPWRPEPPAVTEILECQNADSPEQEQVEPLAATDDAMAPSGDQDDELVKPQRDNALRERGRFQRSRVTDQRDETSAIWPPAVPNGKRQRRIVLASNRREDGPAGGTRATAGDQAPGIDRGRLVRFPFRAIPAEQAATNDAVETVVVEERDADQPTSPFVARSSDEGISSGATTTGASLLVTEPATALETYLTYERAVATALAATLMTIESAVQNQQPSAEPLPDLNNDGRAGALAALGLAVSTGVVTADDAGARRQRLVLAAEASIRLRSLLELHSAGYVPIADLSRKRDSVMAGLMSQVV